MDDLISKKAAIDALKRKQDDGKGDLSRFYNTIIQHDIEAIKQLPPIQPKRGKWIDLHTKEEIYGEMYRCSVCGDFDFGGCFCPNCGADMRSDDMREVTT